MNFLIVTFGQLDANVKITIKALRINLSLMGTQIGKNLSMSGAFGNRRPETDPLVG